MTAREILKQTHSNEILNMDNINSVIKGMVTDKCRIYYVCSNEDLEDCISSVSTSLTQRNLENIRNYYDKTTVLGCAFHRQQIIIIFVKSILFEGKYMPKQMCEKRFYNVLFHELCHLKLSEKGIDDNEHIVNKFARDLCAMNKEFLLNPFNDEAYKQFKLQTNFISSFFGDVWDTIISSPLLIGAIAFLVYRIIVTSI